jgi:hypothetical protein
MTQHALIRGEVCFRAGDGMPVPLPDGDVEIELTDDSATLHWKDAEGNAGSAAIPRDDYECYVREGKIRPDSQ